MAKVVSEVVHRFTAEKRAGSEASDAKGTGEVGYLYEFRPRRHVKKIIFGVEFTELDEGIYRRFKILKRTAQSIFYHPVPDVLDPETREMVTDRRDDQHGSWGTRTKRLDLKDYRERIDRMRNWEATIADLVPFSEIRAASTADWGDTSWHDKWDLWQEQEGWLERPKLWLSLEDHDVWVEGHARLNSCRLGTDLKLPPRAKEPSPEDIKKLKRFLRDNHPDRGGDPAEYRKAVDLYQSMRA